MATKSRSKRRRRRRMTALAGLLVLLLAAALLILLLHNGSGNRSAFAKPTYLNRLYKVASSSQTVSKLFGEGLYSHNLTAEQSKKAEDAMFFGLFEEAFIADGAYFADENGKVLYAKNEYDKWYPASTTKIMTALVACENRTKEQLEEYFTVGYIDGYYEDGVYLLGIEPGDQYRLIDLLYEMFFVSYGDAAAAIAVEIGGDQETFIRMMNDKAKELGFVNTHYVNPHGLYHDDQYTCAYDTYLLIRALYANPVMRELLGATEHEYTYYKQGEELYQYAQHEGLIYQGVYSVPNMTFRGGKTGYTRVSRSNYACVFEYEDTLYYSAVLHSIDAQYLTCLFYDSLFDQDAFFELYETTPVMLPMIDWDA